MKKRIYLDYDAATPADPRVIHAVETTLRESIGNPSSSHSFGRAAEHRLVKARDAVANYLGVRSEEILFTSGATEGANMILRGLFQAPYQGHIISSSVEHAAVHSTIADLETQGCEVTWLSPGPWGAVRPEEVKEACRGNTRLIAIMAVNNETGVKTDVAGIAKVAAEAGIPFFSDGAAWLGKERFAFPTGLSASCFSGQKVYAPLGVGFCFVRRGLKLAPLITGGGQEYGRRAGTENLPGIVGLAEAVSLLEEGFAASRGPSLRDRFETELRRRLPGLSVNGEGPRVASTSNVCFEGVDGESLLIALDMAGIAASHGSACLAGALEPSRVLLGMGHTLEKARSSVRFSFGRPTTEAEVLAAVEVIVETVQRLRQLKI